MPQERDALARFAEHVEYVGRGQQTKEWLCSDASRRKILALVREVQAWRGYDDNMTHQNYTSAQRACAETDAALAEVSHDC